MGGPQPTHSALPILAPYLAPIRTHLTRVTRVSRCTPHGTVAHAQLSSWQAKCARSAGCLLIILDTLVRFTTSCGRRCAARGTTMPQSATQHERSPQALGFHLAACGQGRWKCRVRVSVLARSRGCCGTAVWFCQVGARTCLRSHQARPEERLLPLNVHLTGDLVVGPT